MVYEVQIILIIEVRVEKMREEEEKEIDIKDKKCCDSNCYY